MKAIRLAKSAMPPPLAAHIAHQVATALHYAHTVTRMDGQVVRIVHRDVTPSNIMLQRTGAVKVLDFGIAQATNFARQAETGGGRVKGKLSYLSPEQVRLEPLDGRSDVFALGVVLWEMLVGQRLFSAENEFLTMRNVLTQEVPPPSTKRPEVPPALDAVVARALQRDRARRYDSAQEMADELERFLQEAPCHSHALSRLLQDLFGDESTDDTPDLPDFGSPVNPDARAPLAAVAPATAPAATAEPLIEIEAAPPTPSAHPILVQPWPAAPLPDHRRRLRLLVASAAAVTLVACLGWAMFRGRSHPARAAAREQASWPASPPPAAIAPTPRVAAPPSLVVRGAASPPAPDSRVGGPVLIDAAPGAGRVRAPKKQPPRPISNDVTIDPFR